MYDNGRNPTLIIQFEFALSQPFLDEFVRAALIHSRQEHLPRFIPDWAGMGQHNIGLPFPCPSTDSTFAADPLRQLLFRPPKAPLHQPKPFVTTVCAAKHKATVATELIDFSIDRKYDIVISRFYPVLPAMICSELIADLQSWDAAHDCCECRKSARQQLKLLFPLLITKIQPYCAEDDKVLPRSASCQHQTEAMRSNRPCVSPVR